MKSYTTTELFITSWEQVSYRKLLQLVPYIDNLKKVFNLNSLLLLYRLCHKPKLVTKLTDLQTVDVFRDVSKFTNEPLTKFIINRIGKYYAPADRMANCTMEELALASSFFSFYLATEDKKFLAKLMAVLYRQKQSFWFFKKYSEAYSDCRVPLTNKGIERRATYFERKKFVHQQASLLSFVGCQLEMYKRYPHLFPQSTSEPTEEELNKKITVAGAKRNATNWKDLVSDLTETERFKGDAVGKTANCMEALSYLDTKQKRLIEAERKRKK